MSQNYKSGPNQSPHPTLSNAPSASVHPAETERVAQLIALNKSAQALDFAKDVHKRRRSAASEALLLDAYGARLAWLVERNLDREAAALMDLVNERYPSAAERVREWKAVIAARRGDLVALLEPLNDPSLPAEKQAAIGGRVRHDVFDLRALAQCPALDPEHPLRAAAAVLDKAFEAVTSGPVADDAMALPEVPRSSPLAPWKMLVRAIAAYYRRDDALCEKYLAAVEADSAAARLAPPLRAMLGRQQSLTPAAAALVKQAGGDIEALRTHLKKLDSALDGRNQSLMLQEIRNTIAACRQIQPGLLERLKQHISIRAMTANAKPDKVTAAIDGPSLKNAYFWRLLARSLEEEKDEPMALGYACATWEEFRRHAVHEGWFPAKGPEAATLYLHMADQLRHVAPEDMDRVRAPFERHFDGHAEYYVGQPAQIRALKLNHEDLDLYFLYPDKLLERACEADPCAENFQRWLQLAAHESPAACNLVAECWSEALPNDIAPLLHLMRSAEQRNALQKAFKLMEEAERIDGLNPEVRRARMRLLVSMAVRHLREKKPKLAEKDLRQIEVLPQAQQGDRPAFVSGLRFVWCLLRNARQEADTAYEEAVRFLEDGVTTQLLFLEVERWCGRESSSLADAPPPTVPLFAAWGRVCVLGQDMGMSLQMTEALPVQIMKELSAPNVSANPQGLAAIAEVALKQDHYPFAYAVAGAGLAQGAESQARFLLLRARSLPPWEAERRSSCLAAATELARRRHDSDLLRQIGEWRDEMLDWLDVPEQAKAALSADEIGRVVAREIKQREFPPVRPDLMDDHEDCDCPACCADRGELPPVLADMVDQFGPEAVAQAMADIFGLGGKKKRGRRQSGRDDSDFLF